MSFRPMLRPGQGFKPFTILRRGGKLTGGGRPVAGKPEPMGEFFGIISQASQKEVEQFKQNGHPITHTIIKRGGKNNAVETDVLELCDKDGDQSVTRRFKVQSVQDPGELGHFLIYKVEERADLQ